MNADQRRASRSRGRAARCYALLLRLYPRAHQRAFGEQMLQTFRDSYREAVERQGLSEGHFWLGVVGDEGKSIVREHMAALAERRPSLKKLRVDGWEPLTIVAALALFVALGSAFHSGDLGPFMLLAAPVYVALLFLVARFVRGYPPLNRRRSWWRLGLVLGAVLSLYVVALNLLYALAPVHQEQAAYGDNARPIWLLVLPLLAGIVGVLGGYGGGRVRTGIAASLLAGGVVVLVNILSTALLLVVLWNALQHNLLHSNLQADTQDWIRHQWSVQHPGLAPSLWTYLTNLNDDASAAFGLVLMSLFLVVIWPVPVILGSAIGAQAARRAGDIARLEASATASPGRAWRFGSLIRFILLALALGVLLWSSFALLQSTPTGDTLAFALGYLGASYQTSAFVAWVLAFLIIVAAAYATVRPIRRQREIGATGG